MSCGSCASANEGEFTAEMMIHFPGLKHLANPGVLVFPKVLVCLHCGSSHFIVPETELALLAFPKEVADTRTTALEPESPADKRFSWGTASSLGEGAKGVRQFAAHFS
jgi:hypothetical protein